MNVLVLTTMLPFVHGGAEELAANLVLQLRRHGAAAEMMAIPFTWEPAERLIEEMLIARSLRIANVDRLIALKFPAYLADHPSKTVWLLHQYRQAYDLRDAPSSIGQSNIPDTPRGIQILNAIRAADTGLTRCGGETLHQLPCHRRSPAALYGPRRHRAAAAGERSRAVHGGAVARTSWRAGG